jgi:hypothetical protein
VLWPTNSNCTQICRTGHAQRLRLEEESTVAAVERSINGGVGGDSRTLLGFTLSLEFTLGKFILRTATPLLLVLLPVAALNGARPKEKRITLISPGGLQAIPPRLQSLNSAFQWPVDPL